MRSPYNRPSQEERIPSPLLIVGMSAEIDQNFFPAPTRHGALNADLIQPKPRPGISISSTKAVQELLTENHRKWHIFFNERRFHNHTSHAVLTLWALGADAAILRASYMDHSAYQRPAYASPEPITHSNWKDHLGDEHFYQAYLHFFEEEVKTKSFTKLLDEYIFSSNANVSKGTKDKPDMAGRFLEGLIHPMIHTGFGVEFSLPGIFAEGLAQTAVHGAITSKAISPKWFDGPGLVSRFTEAVTFADKPDVHAFTILARVIEDTELGDFKQPPRDYNFYPDIMETYAEKVTKYVEQWTLDGDLDKKVQELVWVNALLYGVSGASANKDTFIPDFFLMHIVTSSLFLTTIYAEVSRPSQVILLQSYFATCLVWFIGRGRPKLDIKNFFTNPDTLHPVAPGPQPTPHEGANPSPSVAEAVTPNAWLPIIQSTLVHPDDHLCKLQRALSEYALHLGLTPAGTFKNTELKDADLIDGTLFIRTAGLTLSVLGWVREGQAPGEWNFDGFFATS